LQNLENRGEEKSQLTKHLIIGYQTLFKDAQEEIFQMMKYDSYLRFQLTEEYRQFASKKLPIPPNNKVEFAKGKARPSGLA